MSQDTGAAKLPGLPILKTSDQALARWAQAVAEHLEVRAGARGNPMERAVTLRELEESKKVSAMYSVGRYADPDGLAVDLGGGKSASISATAFANMIRGTKLYGDLIKRLDDPTRFDGLRSEIAQILNLSIADVAAELGASVNRLESKLQTDTLSLAYRLEEVTASVEGSASGVRELTFASATAVRAQAGKITQVQARLDDVGGVTIEESMVATADAVTGLEGQYTLKINAGGAVAGFGLAATESLAGATTSSFIVQADKFALIGTGSVPTIPFGVDTETGATYINGSLRINAGGGTLADSVGRFTDYIFRRSTAAPATPTGNNPTASVGGVPAVWFDTPPTSGGDPLYMSKATKTAAGVLIGVWSAPVRLDGTGTEGRYTEAQYAKNTSATTAPSSGFTATQPAIGAGEFMWMQVRTITPPATTGTWGAAVRISGEKGQQGDVGPTSTVAGPQGKRGNVITKISGGWDAGTANAQVASIVSSSGGTPTSPIRGDIVSYTGGAMEYNGSSWGSVAAYIDGSLIVTGTISASVINGGTLSGASISIGVGNTLFSASPANGTNIGKLTVNQCNATQLTVSLASGPAILATATGTGHGIEGKSSSVGAHGVVGFHGGSGPSYDFYAYGSAANYGSFTGAHDTLVANGFLGELGDILVDTGVASKINVSNSICFVALSTSPNQKAATGVLASIPGDLNADYPPASLRARVDTVIDPETDEETIIHVPVANFAALSDTHKLAAMNSLGEGQINVCGEGGPLEIGDLIVTSSVPGKGMRQADDVIRSTTVAKCREAVTFAPGEVKLVACIYLCG